MSAVRPSSKRRWCNALSVASGTAIEVMGMEAVRPVSDIERVQAAWAATFPDALKLELRRLLPRD